jgi:hypothetical protein
MLHVIVYRILLRTAHTFSSLAISMCLILSHVIYLLLDGTGECERGRTKDTLRWRARTNSVMSLRDPFYLSMALLPSVGPWPPFQFLDLLHSR